MVRVIVNIFNNIGNWLNLLTTPKNKDLDIARRERILYILLLGSIMLSAIAAIMLLSVAVINGHFRLYVILEVLFILVLFISIYLISRQGKSVLMSYFIIGLYFLVIISTSYTFGAGMPEGLLIYAMIIVMSGILIGSRFANLGI